MTDEKDKSDMDKEFRDTFFNILKRQGIDVSIDEDGFIRIPYRSIIKDEREDTNNK